ncbi:hypothetical protein L3V83_11175 [Thiotrichales bacterium 19X7-9]|nr:hypothetical protein [Thiotrichales bacterium 19X7-9]
MSDMQTASDLIEFLNNNDKEKCEAKLQELKDDKKLIFIKRSSDKSTNDRYLPDCIIKCPLTLRRILAAVDDINKIEALLKIIKDDLIDENGLALNSYELINIIDDSQIECHFLSDEKLELIKYFIMPIIQSELEQSFNDKYIDFKGIRTLKRDKNCQSIFLKCIQKAFEYACNEARNKTSDEHKKNYIDELDTSKIKSIDGYKDLVKNFARTMSHHTNIFKSRSSNSLTNAYQASVPYIEFIREALDIYSDEWLNVLTSDCYGDGDNEHTYSDFVEGKDNFEIFKNLLKEEKPNSEKLNQTEIQHPFYNAYDKNNMTVNNTYN